MQVFDISLPVRPGMVHYPGDAEVRSERMRSLESGDAYTLTRIEMGVHAGTHVDAPAHFLRGAGTVESLPLEVLIGPASVVDGTGISADIDAATLRRLDIPAGATRLLFKTPNSELWARDGFSPGFFGFTADGARELVSRGVRLLGIDYLSAGPASEPVAPHVALLEAGIVIVEGLDLRGIEPGEYRLVCLPLLLSGCEGAPARAVLLRD